MFDVGTQGDVAELTPVAVSADDGQDFTGISQEAEYAGTGFIVDKIVGIAVTLVKQLKIEITDTELQIIGVLGPIFGLQVIGRIAVKSGIQRQRQKTGTASAISDGVNGSASASWGGSLRPVKNRRTASRIRHPVLGRVGGNPKSEIRNPKWSGGWVMLNYPL